MGTLSMRTALPERRHSWTQKVRIDGQTVYMTVGEYEDGRPGEIFIDVSKQGTFLRGVMGSLARMVSIALQCGADVSVVVHALHGLDYPPSGRVEGSPSVTSCTSVTDWVASELAAAYMNLVVEGHGPPNPGTGETDTRSSESNLFPQEESAPPALGVQVAPPPEDDGWKEANKINPKTTKIGKYKPESWRTGA